MNRLARALALLLVAGLPLSGCGLDLDLPAISLGYGYDVDAEVQAPRMPDMPPPVLPGRYRLIIQAAGLKTAVAPAAVNCNADYLHVDAGPAFRGMVTQSLGRLTGGVEMADALLPATELRRLGLAGQIVVNADALTPRLDFERRFSMERRHFFEIWHAASTAEVDIAATIHVQRATGAVLTTRIAAKTTRRNDDGWAWACDNGAEALAMAAEAAVGQIPSLLTDRFASLERPGHARWQVVTPNGPATGLAGRLAGRTLDLHSVGLVSRQVTDYFDEEWRMVRREGLCDTTGRWSVREGGGAPLLCMELSGQKPECVKVAGTVEAPRYLAADGSVLLETWRNRAGNAEAFDLEAPHCRKQIPY
ncbi:hypothetical protein L2U69_11035 [Zavarzinia compransoris]|uniref:hypothetical protein n=1 Tax=Zavarzinia marina TaxID=2911065 RepID=UPI001F2E99F3|nr:hypothetical protein [Zavarzinia marina]MCF4166179.1 hypothetical protein [Zavarzinia marina]